MHFRSTLYGWDRWRIKSGRWVGGSAAFSGSISVRCAILIYYRKILKSCYLVSMLRSNHLVLLVKLLISVMVFVHIHSMFGTWWILKVLCQVWERAGHSQRKCTTISYQLVCLFLFPKIFLWTVTQIMDKWSWPPSEFKHLANSWIKVSSLIKQI